MDIDDNAPLALRRPRRSNFGKRKSEADLAAAATTPKMASRKRKVRFSDPLPQESGLTPMLKRTKLMCTPKSGRNDRHERRNTTRDLLQEIQELKSRHKTEDQRAATKIAELKAALTRRELRIHELQETPLEDNSERVRELEEHNAGLRQQVEAMERLGEQRAEHLLSLYRQHVCNESAESSTDQGWFTDALLATPSRSRTHMLSPPATSPISGAPTTPSSHRQRILMSPAASSDAGVQTPPLMEVDHSECQAVQNESDKLVRVLRRYKQVVLRLKSRLPTRASDDIKSASSTNATTTLETQVNHLLESLAEQRTSLDHLTTSITALGFPGKDAPSMITSLAASLRTARLELEYLSPGEITLPLASEGAQLLEEITLKLRSLAKQVKRSDDAIDEYHSIEQSLRQQLDARVSSMDKLKAELQKSSVAVDERDQRIEELETGHERYKQALEKYWKEVSGLHDLVTQMESDGSKKDEDLAKQSDAIKKIQKKLQDTVKKTLDLQEELEVAQTSHQKQVNAINGRSAKALAVRDARVSELRGEITAVNDRLFKAYGRIQKLSARSGKLEKENGGLREVVEDLRAQLEKVAGTRRKDEDHVSERSQEQGETPKHKKRRRYDSGLGFLDEEEIDI